MTDTYYEWRVENADGKQKAGGFSSDYDEVEREGSRCLYRYAKGGPHTLIIQRHKTQ